jgi:hypothetical protein
MPNISLFLKELRMTCRVFAVAALTPLALLAVAQAGDKGQTIKGQIKIGIHTVKFEAGELYEIRAEGKGFHPALNINTKNFPFAQEPYEKEAVTHFFVAPETKEYRVYVSPINIWQASEGRLEYTLQVTRIPLSKKPLLKQEDKLTAMDAPYENKKDRVTTDTHHKAYQVTLEAGRFYVIDMVRKGKDFELKDIDPYLYLEDPDGKIMASHYSMNMVNARIGYKARRSGDYRVIASTSSKAVGPFTLIIRKQRKEKE